MLGFHFVSLFYYAHWFKVQGSRFKVENGNAALGLILSRHSLGRAQSNPVRLYFHFFLTAVIFPQLSADTLYETLF